MDTTLLNTTNMYRDLAAKAGDANVLLVCDLLTLASNAGDGQWPLWSEAFRLASAGEITGPLVVLWAAHLRGLGSTAGPFQERANEAFKAWHQRVQAAGAEEEQNAKNLAEINAANARRMSEEGTSRGGQRR